MQMVHLFWYLTSVRWLPQERFRALEQTWTSLADSSLLKLAPTSRTSDRPLAISPPPGGRSVSLRRLVGTVNEMRAKQKRALGPWRWPHIAGGSRFSVTAEYAMWEVLSQLSYQPLPDRVQSYPHQYPLPADPRGAAALELRLQTTSEAMANILGISGGQNRDSSRHSNDVTATGGSMGGPGHSSMVPGYVSGGDGAGSQRQGNNDAAMDVELSQAGSAPGPTRELPDSADMDLTVEPSEEPHPPNLAPSAAENLRNGGADVNMATTTTTTTDAADSSVGVGPGIAAATDAGTNVDDALQLQSQPMTDATSTREGHLDAEPVLSERDRQAPSTALSAHATESAPVAGNNVFVVFPPGSDPSSVYAAPPGADARPVPIPAPRPAARTSGLAPGGAPLTADERRNPVASVNPVAPAPPVESSMTAVGVKPETVVSPSLPAVLLPKAAAFAAPPSRSSGGPIGSTPPTTTNKLASSDGESGSTAALQPRSHSSTVALPSSIYSSSPGVTPATPAVAPAASASETRVKSDAAKVAGDAAVLRNAGKMGAPSKTASTGKPAPPK